MIMFISYAYSPHFSYHCTHATGGDIKYTGRESLEEFFGRYQVLSSDLDERDE